MKHTYAVSDIHGRYDLLTAALDKIEANADGGTIVFTGDYVDRGPQSREVIERLMAGPSDPERWTWICLKGNHEDMMHGAIAGDYEPAWWIGNGGGETISSYGKLVPAAHIQWINGLRLMHADGKRIYVHAGVDPSLPLLEQTEDTLLWSRCGRSKNYSHPDGYVVHGHTPFDDGPVILEGRANLDCGAFFTGRLAVGVFDDEMTGGPIDTLIISGSPA